ncbi:uncharacterized [Tachysurus ichikawai]
MSPSSLSTNVWILTPPRGPPFVLPCHWLIRTSYANLQREEAGSRQEPPNMTSRGRVATDTRRKDSGVKTGNGSAG